jgi:4-amino-4-deoxy-L-arabinose transferase-like glycosyltransferase
MTGLMADAILILHVLIVGFILLGLALTLCGAWRKWRWIRNTWFRCAHLAAIAIVAAQAWAGRVCPLTDWESRLRQGSGDAGYEGGFIEHWMHKMLFYEFEPIIFSLAYSGFALLVLGMWIVAPPNFLRRNRRLQQNDEQTV